MPAFETHLSLYNSYDNAIAEMPGYKVSLSTFKNIWKTYIPNVKFLRPRSDLCVLCKNNRFNAKYWGEEEKAEKVIEWGNHIQKAKEERENYRYVFSIL